MVRIFWALVGLPLATQSIQMPTRRRSPPARAVADAAAEIAATPVDALVLKSGRMNGAILGAVAVSSAYALLHNDALEYANLYETHRLTAATAADVLRRFPTDWLSWYDEAALARPVLVKALTSAYCYFVGDLLAQGLRMEERDVERLDLARAARSSAAGFVGHGPVAHYWLGYMDSLDIGVLPKILLDQGPMSIVYNTSRRRRLFPRPRRNPRPQALHVAHRRVRAAEPAGDPRRRQQHLAARHASEPPILAARAHRDLLRAHPLGAQTALGGRLRDHLDRHPLPGQQRRGT